MRLEPAMGFPKPGQPGIFWLGQAGFWIETGSHRILIDPYLSDSLARKYAGKPNDHRRMMPPPVMVEDLPKPDPVLITHGHTDHMDPDTLSTLARRFPDLPFIVPGARLGLARDRIGPLASLTGMDADETETPLSGLTVTALPAAHETLERDAEGRHVFLGYHLKTDAFSLYHSGDSIPYSGLCERLAHLAPDIALLPVNGRDAARLTAGIPGNFTLDEAISLCRNIPYLITHHFGMFAFNTIDPELIDQAAAALSAKGAQPLLVRPIAGEHLRVLA